MSGEQIFGTLGAAMSIGLMWAGLTAPFNSETHIAWRIIAPIVLIPLGLAAGVGTMFALNMAGAL